MKELQYVFVSLLLLLFEAMAWGNTTSNWIWDNSEPIPNTWMCFRKNIELNELPMNCLAQISADSKYWLWINSRLVVFDGNLKYRPNPGGSFYDETDISGYLKKGKNTIAILVWYWGKSGAGHIPGGKGGLYFNCRMDNVDLQSDGTWKVNRHPAYGNTEKPHPWQAHPESNIYFDARNDIPDWISETYSDSTWKNASVIGKVPDKPWGNLYKRPIPLWKDYGLKNYQNQDSFPRFSDGKVIKARLPYNAQVTPYLKVNASGGLLIDIRSDTYIPNTDKYLTTSGESTLRTDYITKNGVQEFESLSWINGHYIYYKIPNGVEILSLQYRETGYATERTGVFSCDDNFINTLIDKAARTAYVCMRDFYMDCPDRERAPWLGDACIVVPQTFYLFDRNTDLLTKSTISNVIAYQRKDSVFPTQAPCFGYDVELPDQLLTLTGEYGLIWNYFMHTGDSSIIAEIYPSLKKYMGKWVIGSNGLVIHRKGEWDWSDWGEHYDQDILTNAWYFLTLKTVTKFAEILNKREDLINYQKQMTSIKESFNKQFWASNCYKSPGYKGETDDRSNAMAVLAGLADTANWDKIKLVLENEFHASPYMEKFVLEALFKMGYENIALERLKKRYTAMVNDDRTTLWEFWEDTKSRNHAWTGGPAELVYRYVAGISPMDPGYSKYGVFPQPGQFKFINAKLISVQGEIEVKISNQENDFKLFINSPANTRAIIGIPIKLTGLSKKTKISVNGHEIWKNAEFRPAKGIQFCKLDSSYLQFELEPGLYEFEVNKVKY